MSVSKTPYFIWNYELTDAGVRAIFRGANKEQKAWLVAHLDGLQAQVAQLRAFQVETQKELDALMPSILDMAFKGEL
jgi:hypothetical protein